MSEYRYRMERMVEELQARVEQLEGEKAYLEAQLRVVADFPGVTTRLKEWRAVKALEWRAAKAMK